MATSLDELKSRVSTLKAEVSRMMQEPAPATPTRPTAWDVFAEEAGAAIGGVLTSDFLGVTRIGSRTGRAIVRQQRLTQQRQTAVTRRSGAVAVVARVVSGGETSRQHRVCRFRSGREGAPPG